MEIEQPDEPRMGAENREFSGLLEQGRPSIINNLGFAGEEGKREELQPPPIGGSEDREKSQEIS